VSRWTDPDWLAGAYAWVREQLALRGSSVVGEPEQLHVRPWSTVIRLPTTEGNVWFKANADSLAFEAAAVAVLAERRPDCVPPLFGADTDRGWLLMADAGDRLRGVVELERDEGLSRWLDILPLYAGLQLDLAGDVDRLLAAGVPDLRLALLPDLFEAMLPELTDLPDDDRRRLDESRRRVRDLCAELAGYGIAETIQHDDFHDGQVYVREGSYVLLDWGDSCISHPFFTLSVTLEGSLAWGLDDVQGSVDVTPFRDAYLEPFAQATGRDDLVDACTLALRLGWVCRAVNAYRAGGEPDSSQTHARLRMFLDGRP
jgi:hypothetical protein